MLLHELIERNARRYPYQEALLGSGVRITHQELAQRIDRAARCMARLGIGKGDRVLVQMSNLVPYVELYFAVPKLEAILVPLNVRLTPAELPYFISHSGAKCLVTDMERATGFDKDLTGWGEIRERVVVGGSLGGWRSYESLKPDDEISHTTYHPSAEDHVAFIYYTSGTTGKPKGAMWTHRQVIETIFNLQTDLPLSRDDTSLVAVNLSHGPSMLPVLHQVVYMGGKVILYRGPQFRAEEFSELATHEGARVTLLVPTMLSRMLHLEGSGRNWFEGFKYIKYVASRMDPDDLWLAVETMHRSLIQGYGSTETVGGVTFLSPSDHDPNLPGIEKRLASAGREYTNVWVATMNEEGRMLPPGEVGQIVVRSDKSFKGYWKDPGATQEVLKEGWLITGDLGYFDEDGYLYVVDRLSDMIISGGENVYPKEVENVLSNFSKISECAVVGVSDREWGEEVWAFLIPAKGITIETEEVFKFCKGHLAGYKIPRRIVTCQDLPKNYLGKTQKFILQKKAQELKGKHQQNEKLLDYAIRPLNWDQ